MSGDDVSREDEGWLVYAPVVCIEIWARLYSAARRAGSAYKMAEPYDGKTILIVDDDRDILTALEASFKDTGAAILTASDGNSAVTIALEKQPDLLILDAMLPQRSGFLVLEKLKAKKPRGSKPYVIMITGNPGKRHQVWAESLGADGYLNKPFRMDKLMELSQTLLAKG